MKSALHAPAHTKGDSKRLATARAMARFSHPYLVEMRPASPDELAFEPELRGGMRLSDLSRVRFGSGPAPLAFGLRILLDALSGLAALHGASAGFCHGEVAPCNIVVGTDGKSRLIPVVAAHFADKAPPGNEAAGFAAPERLRCDPFDHRADVFSVGVMLWEMITGRSFRGLPPEIITAWVVDGKVPDPGHPDDAVWVLKLGAVAKRALGVNPGARWPHVGVMGEEIEQAAQGHIASVKEIRDLLGEVAQPKTAVSPSENPWTPSLSPTAVSIPPVPVPPAPRVPNVAASHAAPPSVRDVQVAPPSVRESAVPTRRSPKTRRHQSVIAWSTLLTAVVLLAFATKEVLEGLAASRSAPASSPHPAFVVQQPTPPAASAPPVATAEPLIAPAPVAPASAAPSAPEPIAPAAPIASSEPAATSRPARPAPRPAVRRAPVRKAPPPPPAVAKPAKARDDTFGI
jgi:serine/threonine protein kinase